MRILTCIIVVLLLAPDLPAQQNLRPNVPVAIVGGKLLDGYEAPPIHHSVVVFENGLITQVGQRHNTKIPENAVIIDAGGRTVITLNLAQPEDNAVGFEARIVGKW